MHRALKIVLGSLFLVACGGASPTKPQGSSPSDEEGESYVLTQPQLVAVAPGQLQVGDKVQVIGKDFVPAKHGRMKIHFSGYFTDDTSTRQRYEGDVPLTYVNAGMASFEFGPRVLFDAQGDHIGTFAGSAYVVNESMTPDENGDLPSLQSESQAVNLRVLPSIILEQLRSVDGPCQALTTATTGESRIAIGARAIGIGEAAQGEPMDFRFTFEAPLIRATFVKDEFFPNWPQQSAPAFGQDQTGPITIKVATEEGASVLLDPAHLQQSVEVSPPVMVQAQAQTRVKLYQLITGKVENVGQTANIIVEASNRAGDVARRVVPFKVFTKGEVLPWDGKVKLVEQYDPVMTGGPFPGGTAGIDITYTESQSEHRTRTLDFRWDSSATSQVGLDVNGGIPGVFQISASGGMSWTNTFGVNVNESVSSEKSMGINIQKHVFPGQYAAFYRQTKRLERTTDLVFHSECGVSLPVGKAVVTDWQWAFDIAADYQDVPPTNLPPGEQFTE